MQSLYKTAALTQNQVQEVCSLGTGHRTVPTASQGGQCLWQLRPDQIPRRGGGGHIPKAGKEGKRDRDRDSETCPADLKGVPLTRPPEEQQVTDPLARTESLI